MYRLISFLVNLKNNLSIGKLHAIQSKGIVINNERSVIRSLLELDVLMHFIVAGLFLFLLILVISWKFNFINYFSNQNFSKNSNIHVSYTTNNSVNFASIGSQIYINKQAISINKAFEYKPQNIKLTVHGQLKKTVFGFLPYWVLPKIDQINTDLLTSISYFGLNVGYDGNIMVTNSDGTISDGWKGWNSAKLEDFIRTAQKNRIKFYLTLKCFNNNDISHIVLDQKSKTNFINNAIYLMSSRNLDGINIDFEYTGEPSKNVIDGFSLLISDLNNQMKRQYPGAVLTVNTYANAASTTTLDDVAILSQNSNSLIIMGYDFSTPDSSYAGAIAPMDGPGYSITSSINSYLEKVNPNKIILAVPYYGYDWPVRSSTADAQVIYNGNNDVKTYPYAQIMEMIKNRSVQWDSNTLTPWFSYIDPKTSDIRVVHFEDTRSLGIKYDFINQKNLKGVGIWALGFDGSSNSLNQLIADKFANSSN